MKEGIKRRTMRRKERVCLFAFLPSDEGGRAVRGGGRRGGTQPPFWRRKGKISDSTPAPIKQKTKRIKEEKPKSTTRSSTPGREIPDLLIEPRAADRKSEPSNPRGFGGGREGGSQPLRFSFLGSERRSCAAPPPKKTPNRPPHHFLSMLPTLLRRFRVYFSLPSTQIAVGASPTPSAPLYGYFGGGGADEPEGGGGFSPFLTSHPNPANSDGPAKRPARPSSPPPAPTVSHPTWEGRDEKGEQNGGRLFTSDTQTSFLRLPNSLRPPPPGCSRFVLSQNRAFMGLTSELPSRRWGCL